MLPPLVQIRLAIWQFRLATRRLAGGALAVLLAGCAGDGLLLPKDGAPAELRLVSGDQQSAPAGDPVEEPLVVEALDGVGRPVPGAVIVFGFVDPPAGADIAPENATTDGSGRASAEVKLGTPAGDQSVEARLSDPASELSVRFRLTALQRPGGGGGGEGEGGGGGGGGDVGGGGGDGGGAGDGDDDKGKGNDNGKGRGRGNGNGNGDDDNSGEGGGDEGDDDDDATQSAVQIAPCVTGPTGRLSLVNSSGSPQPGRSWRLPMRTTSLFPLAFSAVLLAGCVGESPSNPEAASSGAKETSASERDLTLQMAATPVVEVASPVELSRPMPEPRPAPRSRISPKPAPAPVPDPVPEASSAAESAMPVPAVAVVEVTAEPAPVEDVAVGAGRELAPGKTVTVIPASSGPSSAAEDPSWAPVRPARGIFIGGGGGGDKCRPRGGARGIGIAGRIPVGVPGLRLR